MVKIKTWGARIFLDFQFSSNKVFLYRFWLLQNSGQALCIVSFCHVCDNAGYEKFARVRGLWLVIQWRLNCTSYFFVISYHLISSVTISLGKIICWPPNGGNNHINNTFATARCVGEKENREGTGVQKKKKTVGWLVLFLTFCQVISN